LLELSLNQPDKKILLSINVRLLNGFKNLNGVINKSLCTLETKHWILERLSFSKRSEEVGQACEAILEFKVGPFVNVCTVAS
jgi:hypothetical protein